MAIDHLNGTLYPVGRYTVRTKAIRDVEGTIIASLAHGVVRFNLERIVTVHRRGAVDARTYARMIAPVYLVGFGEPDSPIDAIVHVYYGRYRFITTSGTYN